MKKIFTLLFLSILCLNIYAQEDRKHMEFMGIEMNGPLDKFVEQLQGKGLTVYDVQDDMAIMKGRFATEDNCTIVVSSFGNTVYRVSVMFPERTMWSSLLFDYNKYKELLTKKYLFKPVKSQETFSPPYYEGDGYEMTAVKTDKCIYASQFKIITGDIYLVIVPPGKVTITYDDYQNSKFKDKNDEKEVLDDL